MSPILIALDIALFIGTQSRNIPPGSAFVEQWDEVSHNGLLDPSLNDINQNSQKVTDQTGKSKGQKVIWSNVHRPAVLSVVGLLSPARKGLRAIPGLTKRFA